MSQDGELLTKLTHIIQTAIERDAELRQRYEVGEKFRFIRDRLQSLLDEVQKQPAAHATKKQKETVQVLEDEILVYVHLYNAQGLSVRTWQSIITPKAFFDFSVNRPIYKERSHVLSFIQAKPNRAQHGFLTIAVKVDRITSDENLKDPMGYSLVKVKEGSLRCEKLLCFTHNENEYTLSEEGELVKKTS
ncbi:MAG TPA: type IVB secretion system protein IcmQ [Gammaproteobacteria bacterium]|nr:type IVB secretion system protein IcmQ [Gammaproteobacteria bacterium]